MLKHCTKLQLYINNENKRTYMSTRNKAMYYDLENRGPYIQTEVKISFSLYKLGYLKK